jgi:CRP-like cAMP-binding protein
MVQAASPAALTGVNRHPIASQALFERLAGGGTLPGWEELAAGIAVVFVAAGGSVFLQEAEHPFVYVVRRGLVKNVYLGEDGEEWIKSFSHEGLFFASVAALRPGGRASFSVSAIEPSELERIAFGRLNALAQRHLPWAIVMQRALLIFGERKEKRERELLTLDAEARYRRFLAETPALARRIPQKDLARYLGVTPVGLNRIIKRIERGG